MKQYLVEIQRILIQDKGVISTSDGLTSEFTMNAPASEKEIIECEHILSKRIPEDYIIFLKHYNGGTFFKLKDFSGYRFFSTQELVKENTFQKQNFGKDWNDDILLFSSSIGDNEYLGFKFEGNDYTIVDCVMEFFPEEWEAIEDNFDDLIHKLIKEEGRKYWLGS